MNKPMFTPEAWQEYCLLKRRMEYLEHRYEYAYKYRKDAVEAAYADVKNMSLHHQ